MGCSRILAEHFANFYRTRNAARYGGPSRLGAARRIRVRFGRTDESNSTVHDDFRICSTNSNQVVTSHPGCANRRDCPVSRTHLWVKVRLRCPEPRNDGTNELRNAGFTAAAMSPARRSSSIAVRDPARRASSASHETQPRSPASGCSESSAHPPRWLPVSG